jgi:hypothetical protein
MRRIFKGSNRWHGVSGTYKCINSDIGWSVEIGEGGQIKTVLGGHFERWLQYTTLSKS